MKPLEVEGEQPSVQTSLFSVKSSSSHDFCLRLKRVSPTSFSSLLATNESSTILSKESSSSSFLIALSNESSTKFSFGSLFKSKISSFNLFSLISGSCMEVIVVVVEDNQ
ncbi:hypothetical protein AAZX31_13G027800 [Glycine max]